MHYGEPIQLALRLYADVGAAPTYANQAAFLGAGWIIAFEDMAGAALAAPPVWAIVNTGASGRHRLTFTTPAQDFLLRITEPAGFSIDVPDFLITGANADEDTIVSLITDAIGTPVAGDRVTLFDFECVEADSFRKQITIPLAALSDFGLTDFATGTWTFTSEARTEANAVPTDPADFTLTVATVSAALRQFTIGWDAFPAGAVLSQADILAGGKLFLVDVQAARSAPLPALKITGIKIRLRITRQETRT